MGDFDWLIDWLIDLFVYFFIYLFSYMYFFYFFSQLAAWLKRLVILTGHTTLGLTSEDDGMHFLPE